MASSSSEDSLLELLELLLLLIVASECCQVRSVPVCRALEGCPSGGEGVRRPGICRSGRRAAVQRPSVVAQRNAGGVQRQLLA